MNDVIYVTETWLDSDILNGELLDGYAVPHCCHDFQSSGQLSGGDVFLDVKQHVSVVPITSLCACPYDSLVVNVSPQNCLPFITACMDFPCPCPALCSATQICVHQLFSPGLECFLHRMA